MPIVFSVIFYHFVRDQIVKKRKSTTIRASILATTVSCICYKCSLVSFPFYGKILIIPHNTVFFMRAPKF